MKDRIVINHFKQINQLGIKFLGLKLPSEVYKATVCEAVALLEANYGSLVIDNNGKLQVVYATHSLLRSSNIFSNEELWKLLNSKQFFLNQGKELELIRMELGVKSSISIPLFDDKKLIGVLSLYSREEDFFINFEAELLSTLSSIISLAIIRSRILIESELAKETTNTLQSSERILEKINKASLHFLEQLTESETYEIIVKESTKLVGGVYGSLILMNNHKFERVFSTLPDYTNVRPRKKGFTAQAFNAKKAFVVSAESKETFHQTVKDLGIRSSIYVPLTYKGQSIGVLVINSKEEKQFTLKELRILELFGSTIVLAIRKNQLTEELAQALKMRDLFISMASHELRTPMTTVHGYVQMIKGKVVDGKLIDKRIIDDLEMETLRLKLLIEELLQTNHIKTGKLQFFWRECNLKEIINRSIQNIKFSYPDRQVIFDDQVGGQESRVIGDVDKIIQVLINLVDNSLKFSEAEKPVIMKLTGDERSYMIEIVDLGKGIPKEELSRVHEGFFRGKNNQKEGMGLGLYIAKNIIQGHRGNFEIKSAVGHGTTIKITLPKSEL